MHHIFRGYPTGANPGSVAYIDGFCDGGTGSSGQLSQAPGWSKQSSSVGKGQVRYHQGTVVPLYIGMTRVSYHHLHEFEKSNFQFQFLFNFNSNNTM